MAPMLALAAALGFVATGVQGALQCDADYASLQAGDTCVSTWAKLTKGTHQIRPTEPGVGYGWVVAQKGNHFGSASAAQKWFGKHAFPVVLGGEDFFLTDNHHHALAIQLTGDQDIWDLELSLFVQCDLRDAGSSFWSIMAQSNYAFLHARADTAPFSTQLQSIDPADLPQDWALSSFHDDMWRSLAGFASHVADDSQRCYVKECTAFVDYEWGYAMNVAVEAQPGLWPAGSDAASFKARFEAMVHKPSPKEVDLDAWAALAQEVLPLCHGTGIKTFQLPSGFPAKTVQGWSSVPVPSDPTCQGQTCPLSSIMAV